MSGTHTTLDAAATERKARLAKLASLKRKQPGSDTTIAATSLSSSTTTLPDNNDHQQDGNQVDTTIAAADQQQQSTTTTTASSETPTYLSGRTYDPETRGPKLGFENAPASNEETVEERAERLVRDVSEKAARDEAEEAEKGIDLFKLQPRKPNWDLKRDLAEKTRVLNVRTQNAIARLVRERIENAKQEALRKPIAKPENEKDQGGEELGLDGNTLVEGVHLREREEEEDEKRERQIELEEEAVS